MRNLFYNLSYGIIIIVFAYVSLITGTFVHELLHADEMDNPQLLQINFDGSGFTRGTVYNEAVTFYSHKMIYLVDYATSFITFITLWFLLVIVKGGRDEIL